jgi:hypothetical protein
MRAEDDFSDFVHKVREPELPRQAQTWGLPHEEIEEIRLDGAAAGLLPILAKLAGPPLEKPTEAFYVTRTYDKASYDPVHVLPFVADLFVNTQKKGSVAWVGRHARMFNLFREFRLGMGFKGPIMVCQEDADSLGASAMGGVEVTSPAGMCSRADAFVFDYVSPDGGPIPDEGEAAETGWVAHLTRTFLLVVETERARMRRGAPQRRVIAINAIHSRFEKMVTFNVNAGIAPYGTRLRYGLVKEFNPGPYQWLALGTTGAAGLRKGDRIETVPGVEGHVVYGPYFPLAPGKYHAVFGLDVEERAPLAGEQVERGKRAVYLDVVSAHETRFGAGEIIDGELKSGEYCVAFEIGEEDETQLRASAMEARVWTNGKYQFAVTSVRVERLDEERRPGKEESKSNAGGK